MTMHFLFIQLFVLAAIVAAVPVVEGDCVRQDHGLQWLVSKLSNSAAVSCLGQPLQKHNAQRYWGTQFSKDAQVVVYPGSTEDVSFAVRAARMSPTGNDFAIVCGGHSMINASSAYGFVLDLSKMSNARVAHDFRHSDGRTIVAIEYQGGATWGQVQTATNGSGYTAVGARVDNVGAGGFSLGGGIGFLAGAHGFAVDRLVQMEVVLADGKIVLATKTNEYRDLFWALQGGSGQFGVVTRFWQEAVREPKTSTLGFYYIDDADVPRLQEQTVAWFQHNKDPFSVVYYSYGYLPSTLQNPTPADYAKRTLLITVHFDDPTQPNQPDNNAAFASIFSGINTKNGAVITSKYYSDLVFAGQAAYPYGYRRGFYGPQTSQIDVAFLQTLTSSFGRYIDQQILAGEHPYSASMVVQYMFPGLNGRLPKLDTDTAWPHSKVGHQMLFTPAYRRATGDACARAALQAFNQLTYDQQRKTGGFIANYPNYISPGDSGRMVWGDNVERLIQIKAKYDPRCLIRNGRVFATSECIKGGWANIYA
ncbi:hypothetical protein VHEMI03195 [[Torrubiella] hemipterigena]|uniref:FAD-binding PCMH-type domain-containing protein n=1 Tax=[Torrubiella] hemipterigena TaxID=1531966 RepID=A0A0A1TCU0_9HYPO|nr:hypothetical protein VHEMI03195 [[Torrubiella] hemipterigena]